VGSQNYQELYSISGYTLENRFAFRSILFCSYKVAAHMDLISRIFFSVRFDLIDHWLTSVVEESGALEKAEEKYNVLTSHFY
jgi:hypothetical protein